MKTHKVRPVLVETKENTGITLGINITRNIPGVFRGQNYQLILISLEDAKIEVGDKFYDEESKTIETSFGIMNGLIVIKENSNVGCNPDFCSKVIATQGQMPPEYIQQFIEEYNKGEVKDVEIEMIGHIQSVFDKPHIKPIIYTEGDTEKYLEIIRRFKNHCNDTSWPSESFRKKVIKMLGKK